MSNDDLLQWQAFAAVVRYPDQRHLFEARWFRDANMREVADKILAQGDEVDWGTVSLKLNARQEELAMSSSAVACAAVNVRATSDALMRQWLARSFEQRVRRLQAPASKSVPVFGR